MNQLILYAAEHGISQLLYNIFFAAGFVAIFIFAFFYCKNYSIPRSRALLLIFFVYTISVLWMFFQCWVENGFKGWGGNNIVRTFVWVPVAALLVTKAMKMDWLKACDFIAPCVPMVQAVSHWGCIFTGCCHGYPSNWGIYNTALKQTVFPCPPLEAIVALLVVVIVCRYEKKKNYRSDGLAYPLMLMLFGYSRFLLEFLRDNQKVVFGVSTLALHALFMALVGTAAYVTIQEKLTKKAAKVKNGRK